MRWVGADGFGGLDLGLFSSRGGLAGGCGVGSGVVYEDARTVCTTRSTAQRNRRQTSTHERGTILAETRSGPEVSTVVLGVIRKSPASITQIKRTTIEMHEVLSGLAFATVFTETCITFIVAVLAESLVFTLASCELLVALIAYRLIIQIKQEAPFAHFEDGTIIAVIFVGRVCREAVRTCIVDWRSCVHGLLDVAIAAIAQRVGNSVATDKLERGGSEIATVTESAAVRRHLVCV